MFKFDVFCNGSYVASYWADDALEAEGRLLEEFGSRYSSKDSVVTVSRAKVR